jgi:hypothetical protein
MYTLEVSVHYHWFVCVHLEVAQQNFFYFAVYFHIQDRSVECFFTQCVEQCVVIQSDCYWRFSATVDDAWCLASAAQAAARSGPLLFACECCDFHGVTPNCASNACGETAPRPGPQKKRRHRTAQECFV